MKAGKYIATLRRRDELSQRALAKHVSMSPQYLSDIEKGRRKPPYRTIVKIAMALNESVEHLCFLYGIIPPDMVDKNAKKETVVSALGQFRRVLKQ